MRNTYEDWKRRGVLYDARRKTGDAKLCMQIHDELVAELREGREDLGHEMQKHMENAVQLRVPMKAEVKFGKSWGSCH
jgi:DNA polymerase-1